MEGEDGGRQQVVVMHRAKNFKQLQERLCFESSVQIGRGNVSCSPSAFPTLMTKNVNFACQALTNLKHPSGVSSDSLLTAAWRNVYTLATSSVILANKERATRLLSPVFRLRVLHRPLLRGVLWLWSSLSDTHTQPD